MVIGMVVSLIGDLLLAIVHLLERILLLGVVKNNMLLPVLVLKLNIVLMLVLLLKCYGSSIGVKCYCSSSYGDVL